MANILRLLNPLYHWNRASDFFQKGEYTQVIKHDLIAGTELGAAAAAAVSMLSGTISADAVKALAIGNAVGLSGSIKNLISKYNLTSKIFESEIFKTIIKYSRTISSGAATAAVVPLLGNLLNEMGNEPTMFYATASSFLGTMVFLTYLKESGKFERYFPRANKFLDEFVNAPYYYAKSKKHD